MLKGISHVYSIKETARGRFQVLKVISEHNTQEEAVGSMLKAINQESSVNMEFEVEQLKAKGVDAMTFEDAVKSMDSEELERFLKERRQKFFSRVLDENIKILKNRKKKQ